MLDRWERVMVDAVIERVESGAGSARAGCAGCSGWRGTVDDLLGIELAVRDWSRRDAGVAERVRRVDNRRMAYMRGLFGELFADPADVEMRCLMVMSLFVGNHHIAAEHGRRTRSAVMKDTLRWLLS